MDPFLIVNKAYAMILRVEKQKEVQNMVIESSESPAVIMAKSQNSIKDNNTGFKTHGRRNRRKDDRHYTFCNTTGHTEDACFKIIGYPDWYKDLKEKRGRQQIHTANAMLTETPLEIKNATSTLASPNKPED